MPELRSINSSGQVLTVALLWSLVPATQLECLHPGQAAQGDLASLCSLASVSTQSTTNWEQYRHRNKVADTGVAVDFDENDVNLGISDNLLRWIVALQIALFASDQPLCQAAVLAAQYLCQYSDVHWASLARPAPALPRSTAVHWVTGGSANCQIIKEAITNSYPPQMNNLLQKLLTVCQWCKALN